MARTTTTKADLEAKIEAMMTLMTQQEATIETLSEEAREAKATATEEAKAKEAEAKAREAVQKKLDMLTAKSEIKLSEKLTYMDVQETTNFVVGSTLDLFDGVANRTAKITDALIDPLLLSSEVVTNALKKTVEVQNATAELDVKLQARQYVTKAVIKEARLKSQLDDDIKADVEKKIQDMLAQHNL